MKKILILGGGTGGTIVANRLAHGLKPEEAEIELVSSTPLHYYQPAQLYVPFGEEDPRKLARRERSFLSDRIALRIDTATKWIAEERKVQTKKGAELSYDYLVIATGSAVVPEAIPGFAEAADHFYSPEAAYRLYQRLSEFEGGRIVVGIGAIPFKCPVSPMEFVFLLDSHLSGRGIREKTEIVYTYPLGDVFNIASLVPMLRAHFEKRSIRVETFFNLESVDPQKRVVKSMEGTELPFDLLVMTPVHKGAAFLRGHPMADNDGWVKTDRHSLRVGGLDHVWALGDTTDLPISKAGSTAHFQAPVISEQILRAVQRHPADGKALYNGHVMCFIEVGHGKATAIDFDYDHPPKPHEPSEFYHLQKAGLNHLYWYLVPTAVV